MTTNVPRLTLSEDYNLLESAQQDITKLQGMRDSNIKAAYLANILSSLILLKCGDKMSQKMLHDPTGKTLKKYNKNMSPLNFWGLIVHNSNEAKIKENIGDSNAASLKKTTGRIMKETIKTIHYPISTKGKIDWVEMMDAVRIITLRLPLRNARVNRIREGLEKWDNLKANEKAKVISDAFYFMMENDNNSVLLTRLRAISNSTLTSASAEHTDTLKSVKKLKEEDGGGEGGGDGGGAEGTTSGDIAAVPYKFFNGKPIKRKPRGYTRLKPYEKTKRKRKKKSKKKK